MEAVDPPHPELAKEQTLLQRIRNMWEFANLAQYIYLFGKAVKIDEDLGIEELEMECLKTNSPVLQSIGLALLKYVSSHRGLTPEIFDEYTRRQYMAKAPQRNPFGVEDVPVSFSEFYIFTQICVLQQLTQWTMGNPDRIREKMVDDLKDEKQTLWRIEPFGWDAQERTYIVLDDDRLYRRTDPPPPPPPAPKPKKNSRRSKASSRASKRRKVSEPVENAQADVAVDAIAPDEEIAEDNGLGGAKWECLAVGLEELQAFLVTIEKTRDPNEKTLRKRLTDDLLPLLAKREEARQRKEAQKQRELMNLEKLATAKRSSRIAGRMELQKQEDEAREAERRKEAELAMAKKEQQKWTKLEKERDSRMQTREQRLREREARRILHEEELSQLSEDSKKVETGESRISERHIKAEIERKKKALEEMADLEEDWIFDCICGAYGQIDDGTHSISCEECNVWQHSKCLGVSQAEAEREDFHFLCGTCRRRAEDAEKSRTHPIKIKLGRPSSSMSSTAIQPQVNGTPSMPSLQPTNGNRLSSQTLGQASTHSTLNHHAAPGPSAIGSSHAQISGNTSIQHSSRHQRADAHADEPASMLKFNSPTSLPPPAQPRMYKFVNGHATNGPSTSVEPQHLPYKSNSQTPSFPLPGSPYHYRPQTGHQNGNNTTARGSSTSFPPPLASAPVLTPRQYNNNSPSTPAPGLPQYNIHDESVSRTNFPPSSPSKHSSPLPAYHVQPLQVSDDHSSALPPATTGLSPTKHSPPRPSTSNGDVIHATPSVLPPIAPLLPSSPVQNLSPPVKSADPEHARHQSATINGSYQ